MSILAEVKIWGSTGAVHSLCPEDYEMYRKTRISPHTISQIVILLGLIVLTGCQNYSESESKVYQFASSLKNSIPAGLEMNGERYEGELEGNEKQISGFVNPSPLTVGGGKKDDPDSMIVFLHTVPEDEFTDYVEEGFMLLESGSATFYLYENNTWKKGMCVFDSSKDFIAQLDDCINTILESGEVVHDSSVKRYLKLSDRVRDTYFRRQAGSE